MTPIVVGFMTISEWRQQAGSMRSPSCDTQPVRGLSGHPGVLACAVNACRNTHI